MSESKLYERVGRVRARRMVEPFTLTSPNGTILQGKAGDYLVVHDPPRLIGGRLDTWPCELLTFEETHRAVEAQSDEATHAAELFPDGE